jgi:hypothetical protein
MAAGVTFVYGVRDRTLARSTPVNAKGFSLSDCGAFAMSCHPGGLIQFKGQISKTPILVKRWVFNIAAFPFARKYL